MSVRDKSRNNKRNHKQTVEQANLEAMANWVEPIPFNYESTITNNNNALNSEMETNMNASVELETTIQETQVAPEVETPETPEGKKINLNEVQDKWTMLGEQLKNTDWVNVTGEELVTEFNLPEAIPMASVQAVVNMFPPTMQPLIKQGVMAALDEETQTVSVAKLINLVKPWVPMIVQGLQEQLVGWLTDKVTVFLTNTLSKVDFTVFMPAPQATTTVITTVTDDEDTPSIQYSAEVVYDLKAGMNVLVIMDKYFLSIKGSRRYTELKEGLYQLKYSKGW